MELTRHIIFKLFFLLVAIPIFAYGLMYSIESLTKAWKSGSKVKKWWALCLSLLFLAIALGGLN